MPCTEVFIIISRHSVADRLLPSQFKENILLCHSLAQLPLATLNLQSAQEAYYISIAHLKYHLYLLLGKAW